MFSATRFVLNICSLPPKQLSECNKAKKLYIKDHQECAVCGSIKSLEVHHVMPVHLFPGMSASQLNFIVLCDTGNMGCHKHFGHFGSFYDYNEYIREYAIASRFFIEKYDKTRKFMIPTSKLIKEFAIACNISDKEFVLKSKVLYDNLFDSILITLE